MTYTVSVYGRGNELCIGSISKETWDYIQEHFDGDSGEYLEALENGDIPDEHMLAPDQYSFYECDDLHHHDACSSTYYTITVEDEDGHEVFSFNNEDAEKKGVQIETNAYSIDDTIPYLSIYTSCAKGRYLVGELDIEGEFDSTKLKVVYGKVCWNHDEECNETVDRLEYDGCDIDCEFDSTDGKGDSVDFIEVEQYPDDV